MVYRNSQSALWSCGQCIHIPDVIQSIANISSPIGQFLSQDQMPALLLADVGSRGSLRLLTSPVKGSGGVNQIL